MVPLSLLTVIVCECDRNKWSVNKRCLTNVRVQIGNIQFSCEACSRVLYSGSHDEHMALRKFCPRGLLISYTTYSLHTRERNMKLNCTEEVFLVERSFCFRNPEKVIKRDIMCSRSNEVFPYSLFLCLCRRFMFLAAAWVYWRRIPLLIQILNGRK